MNTPLLQLNMKIKRSVLLMQQTKDKNASKQMGKSILMVLMEGTSQLNRFEPPNPATSRFNYGFDT